MAEKRKAKLEPRPDDEEQFRRFVDKAKDLEAGTSERFETALDSILKAPANGGTPRNRRRR